MVSAVYERVAIGLQPSVKHSTRNKFLLLEYRVLFKQKATSCILGHILRKQVLSVTHDIHSYKRSSHLRFYLS